ncbi:delta(3,5)-Delta(2,4)-dienoyl-CoA isomerase, mitochondrial-like [Xenia sp. Carnegie-2017]|uniref:delta(3,5)-Delta(2,4)-dienoyl-CoA isomerase, mitochondrial-like n=1 Tax=Xenia sp. Carnegie-2017 TaxID=2897299 RepID=UPI001F04F430|nr:delta(3,5)-Delta(2,4)-dienoyl-CoA isomerase, mitochondrial-like [Xenia sp. Carnegie-2017]
MSMVWHSLRVFKSLSKGHVRQMVKSSVAQMSSLLNHDFETLELTQPRNHVYQVNINRPEKRNAMNQTFWKEMVTCFEKIANESDCRVVVLSAAGKIFTAGLDLMDFSSIVLQQDDKDVSRKAYNMRKTIVQCQESFSVIERCPQPVIAAIHSACVGGGVDMICSCDIRWCTSDAWFQIKEVELGLAADVGTLQRLPKIVGNESLVRELCFTARKFMAEEAKSFGLVSRIFQDKESLLNGALDLASHIAKMSPIAITGTKKNLNYSRDHGVDESLEYMATWNMSMLQTEDILKAVQAGMNKEEASFSKL